MKTSKYLFILIYLNSEKCCTKEEKLKHSKFEIVDKKAKRKASLRK